MTPIGYRMPSVGADSGITGFALTDIIVPRTIQFGRQTGDSRWRSRMTVEMHASSIAK
jgi:hypothetical protein